MKNLQEIMNEMSNLSEQIAVTLNDEEVTPCTPCAEKADVALDNAAVLPVSACGPVDNDVNFCCAVNIPGNFRPVTPIVPRILYDLSCLKVIVEECCTTTTVSTPGGGTTTVSIPGYNIRIVGCIPFVINVPLLFSPGVGGTCVIPYSAVPSERTVSACCSGSVCVDNIIGRVCSERDAILASGNIRLNCDTVIAAFNPANPTLNNCAVIVTGRFTLPTI